MIFVWAADDEMVDPLCFVFAVDSKYRKDKNHGIDKRIKTLAFSIK